MTASTVAGFLFGKARSIEAVASSRASFWTGLLLVLLTAIARNYDQTFVTEKGFLWLFGPLMFSVFSGTWVFLIAYGIAWGYMGTERPSLWTQWPAFMGVFWMTAPIAWLYAIPVERMFDSVTAARANIALLAIVSMWRVLLMARVFQVLNRAPFLMALFWVLIAATVEVLVISFFGAGFTKRVMAGMSGMRNSPEEEVVLRALGVVFSVSVWLLPVAVVGSLVYRLKASAHQWPARRPDSIPWIAISIVTVFWLGISILPQRELSNSVAVERLIANEQYRKALDYLSSREPHQFAPSRTLPPKAFEREVFEQLPALFAAVTPGDPPWVHRHLLRRLDEMCSHFGPGSSSTESKLSREERINSLSHGIEHASRYGEIGGAEFSSILHALNRMGEGQNWISTNDIFLAALAVVARQETISIGRNAAREDAQRKDWQLLTAQLATLGITNIPPAVTRAAHE